MFHSPFTCIYLGISPPEHTHHPLPHPPSPPVRSIRPYVNQLQLGAWCGGRRACLKRMLNRVLRTAERTHPDLSSFRPEHHTEALRLPHSHHQWTHRPAGPRKRGPTSSLTPGICNSCFPKATTELFNWTFYSIHPSLHPSVLCLPWLKAGKEDGDPWNRHHWAYLSCPDVGPHFVNKHTHVQSPLPTFHPFL